LAGSGHQTETLPAYVKLTYPIITHPVWDLQVIARSKLMEWRPGSHSRYAKYSIFVFLAGAIVVLSAVEAQAAVTSETGFILSTLSLLVHGLLVFWMAAGFAALESGRVRTKSVSTILLKNITIVSIAGLAFYLLGYNLMYDGVDGGFLGSVKLWSSQDAAANAGDFQQGRASAAHWYFQMVFVATAASVTSGTLAERIKLWPFFAFVLVMTAVIYPIQGAWLWGGGWLMKLGFYDFAGSTIVHSVGGWAALTGAVILGARRGKYDEGGKVQKINGSSLPLVTLGTFILWLGWLGFNGGSLPQLASAQDAISLAIIYTNTTMAAAGGILSSVVLLQLLSKRIDVTIVLNGALAGLVSITANPATPDMGQAMLIGAVGGAIVVWTTPLLDRFKIDDVVGAVPVHLFAGIWGTLAAGFTHPEAQIGTQIIGVLAIGLFVAATSAATWLALKHTVGIRLSKGEEMLGLDKVELGTPAYPEFRVG
jgi:Amt family ammonium transporter